MILTIFMKTQKSIQLNVDQEINAFEIGQMLDEHQIFHACGWNYQRIVDVFEFDTSTANCLTLTARNF